MCLFNNMSVKADSGIKLKFDLNDYRSKKILLSKNDRTTEHKINFLIKKHLWPISSSHALLPKKDIDCVIANKKIMFVLENSNTLTAVDKTIGNIMWVSRICKNRHNCKFKYNMFHEDNIILIKSCLEVFAISADNGNMLWKYEIQNPSRANLVIKNRKVFIKSINNTVEALSLRTGRVIWKHRGTLSKIHTLDASEPIVTPELVIITYNSGEIFALRSNDGCEVWARKINSIKNYSCNSVFRSISLKKTYKNDILYTVSSEGSIFAINIKTGSLIWERNVIGKIISDPLILEKILLIPLKNNKLICLASKGGYVIWIKDFNGKSYNNKSFFISNIIKIIKGKIILVIENEYIVVLSPYNGNEIYRTNLLEHISITPIVYDNYILIYNKFNLIEYEL